MNLSLSEHWEEFIAEQVNSGRYNSASEVVRDGLRLIEKQAQLDKLRKELEDAIKLGGSNTSEDVLADVANHLKTIDL